MNRILYLVAVTALSSIFLVAGCSPTTNTTDSNPTQNSDDQDHDHDHDHGPELSFKETLEKTSNLAAKLNQGFADGADHDVVHDPLHEISHLLEALPKQITESELSDENKKTLTTAVDALMDNYGKIDAKFHGGEGVEFADVKDEITGALESLDNVLGTLQ